MNDLFSQSTNLNKNQLNSFDFKPIIFKSEFSLDKQESLMNTKDEEEEEKLCYNSNDNSLNFLNEQFKLKENSSALFPKSNINEFKR